MTYLFVNVRVKCHCLFFDTILTFNGFLAVCQAQIAVMYRANALIHGSRTCERRGKACLHPRFQIMNLKCDPELLHQTGNSSICEMNN